MPMGGRSAILSHRNIEEVRSELNDFINNIDSFCDELKKVLQRFSNEEIVRSLFESGNFGAEQEAYLMNLANQIEKFRNQMIQDSDGAIRKSIEFLNNQENLVNRGEM